MEYIAEISWLKPEEGGRKSQIPFHTNKYAPQIRFDGLQGSWSVVVCNYKKIEEFKTLAKLHYLNEECAPNNLCVGLEFTLYEGCNMVAQGIIKEKNMTIKSYEINGGILYVSKDSLSFR